MLAYTYMFFVVIKLSAAHTEDDSLYCSSNRMFVHNKDKPSPIYLVLLGSLKTHLNKT